MLVRGGVLKSCKEAQLSRRIVIPDSVRYIAPDVFKNCRLLEEVVIPAGAASIGNSAFRGCRSLKRIDLPDSVRQLDTAVFRDCTALEEVRLPQKITSVPHHAFGGCTSLVSVYIPDGVKHIGYMAFSGCTSLSAVRLPETLTLIENEAFHKTSSLKSLVIPDGLEQIVHSTFARSALGHVRYIGLDAYWESNEAGLFFPSSFSEGLKRGVLDLTGVPDYLAVPFAVAFYAKTRSSETGAFLKERLPDVFENLFLSNDTLAAQAVVDGLLTAEDIDRFIGLSSERGRHEIYIMLVERKDRLGGYGGERLKL